MCRGSTNPVLYESYSGPVGEHLLCSACGYRGVLINICPEMCFGTRQELCSLPKAKECAHVWVVLPSAGNVGASLSALPSLEFVEFKCDPEEPVGF